MFEKLVSGLFGTDDSTDENESDDGSTPHVDVGASVDADFDHDPVPDGFAFARVDEQPYEHYTQAIDDVERLKRERRHDEVEEILLWCIDYTEAEARDDGTYSSKPAPVYYRHLGIVYRKDDRHADEVALLKRYMGVCDDLDGDPNRELVNRLERARELAG